MRPAAAIVRTRTIVSDALRFRQSEGKCLSELWSESSESSLTKGTRRHLTCAPDLSKERTKDSPATKPRHLPYRDRCPAWRTAMPGWRDKSAKQTGRQHRGQ